MGICTPLATADRDDDSAVIWFVEECQRNGVRPESCVRLAEAAGDPEFAEFFRRAARRSFTTLSGAVS
jgi:hypothetical protein